MPNCRSKKLFIKNLSNKYKEHHTNKIIVKYRPPVFKGHNNQIKTHQKFRPQTVSANINVVLSVSIKTTSNIRPLRDWVNGGLNILIN